jgi:iron complex transport system substrate-binding protein
MKARFKILVATIPLFLIACSNPVEEVDSLPAPEVSLIEATFSPQPTPTSELFTLTDAFGRDVIIGSNPDKVISLSSSITESLFAIGAREVLIARDSLSSYPPEVEQIANFGDQFADFNAQSYIALMPDLVIANEHFPFESIAGLEALGIPVFILGIPQDIEGLMSNISVLGTLTGQQAEADTFLQEMDLRLSAIELALQNSETMPSVFYELEASDPNSPWTIGDGTILDEILSLADGINASAGYTGRWVQIPLGDLQAIDPQIILLADAAFGVLPESLSTRPGWESLSAVTSGQIYSFDDVQVSNPGPRIIDIVEEIAELLHPDSFD